MRFIVIAAGTEVQDFEDEFPTFYGDTYIVKFDVIVRLTLRMDMF